MTAQIFRYFFIILGVFCLLASHLFASTADTYGLSSRASATAGLSNFETPDAYVTYQNPAFLANAKKIQMSSGMLNVLDLFLPIENVVVQNETSGKALEYGNIKTDYSNLSGFNFGLVLPLKKVVLGITGFLPIGSLASVNTSEYYIPVYGVYYNRPKRFSLVSGIGFKISDSLSFGFSGNFYLTSGASTKINLNEQNSTVDLAMDIKPAVAPIVGLNYHVSSWNIDLTYRAALNYSMKLASHADMVFLGATDEDSGEVSFPVMEFLAQTAMFYDPAMVGFGVSKHFAKGVQLGARVDWKNWKRYQAASSQVEFTNPGGIESKVPQIDFKDVLSPSLGIEFPINSFWMRAGYRYEPEHVLFQEANSNFMDTNVHIMSAGLGKSFKDPLGLWQYPLTLDVHLQYHRLAPKHVDKSDTTDIGAKPGGYDVGGSLINYGLTLTTTL